MKRFKRIYIEITNICNMHCKFCPKDIREKSSMSLSQIENIFIKIKEYTDYIYLHVKGEPLIHENIDKVLDLAEKYGLKVIITTNGTLLKQRQELLKDKTALRQINISIHSFEQNNLDNNKYMQDVIEAVENITENNPIYISYRLWNMKNMEDVQKNKQTLQKIAIAYNIKNIMEQVKEKSFVDLQNNKYINLDTMFRWPSLDDEYIDSKGSCLGLIDQLAILVDGTVVPCCLDSNGVINLGDIFKEEFMDILEKDRTKNIIDGFKQNSLQEELCKKCEFRRNKRR